MLYRTLLVLAIAALLPIASALEFVTINQGTFQDGDTNTLVVHDTGIDEFSPSQISDYYPHFYGKHYVRSVNTIHEPTSCNFTTFDCKVGNRTLTLTYPRETNSTVPNSPNFVLSDTGTVCFKDDCLAFTANVQVYNLNWRIESNTGADLGPFVSPNGYNVIPLIGLGAALFAIWYFSQPKSRRFRSGISR